jgi:hypothetical protein
VKRSGRDEPMWVATHMCMEAMLGISLSRYLYLKLAKTLSFFIISYVFIRDNMKRGQNRFCPEAGMEGLRWPK